MSDLTTGWLERITEFAMEAWIGQARSESSRLDPANMPPTIPVHSRVGAGRSTRQPATHARGYGRRVS